VGADARPTAEHILVVDFDARAAATVAAAYAGGGGGETAVRHRRQPSPAPAANDAGGDAPTTFRTQRGPSPALAANDADSGAPTTQFTRGEPRPALAADLAGGGAPTAVRYRREPSPAPVVVHADACSRTASPPRPPSPFHAVTAVNYNVFKSMGSSLGWTDEDRVPLCRALLEVSGDPVMATGRSKDELWAAVRKKWTDLMDWKDPLRVKHNVSAIAKQFKKIRKGVSTFTSHYLAVKNTKTTVVPQKT